MRAQIIGTGSCLPEKIVTNDFLSTIVDTSDEWISSRTGIRQRHIAVEETTASMSTEAGRRALESAGVKAEELDLIIVATCTPDTLVPNTACLVQSELGARIQDEAHRFAIEYHRSLRSKQQVHSVLDDIPNIGQTRRKALMRQFQSLEKIREATVEQLREVDGMNEKAARSVYEFFHKQ